MSANVKLGDDRLDNIDSVELENADAPGEYVQFYLNGGSHEYSAGDGISIVDDEISVSANPTQFEFDSLRELKIRLGNGLVVEPSEGVTVDSNVVQSKLHSSGENQNIKTINGQSPLGTGNIEISGGSQGISCQLVILVSDWNGGTTCTKSVTGVTATSIVIVDTSNSNVECTAQGDGTLTFTATETPTSSVNVKIAIFQSSQPVETYDVYLSLSGCSGDNDETSIPAGESYTNTITANTGYTLTGAEVHITMGSRDITTTAWNNGTISIPSVDGDISIEIVAAEIVAYVAVIRNLTSCASTETNPPTQTLKGQQYQESFVASSSSYDLDEATVHVYVGGVEISNVWTYNNNVGTVTIPASEVTGDIVMSIQAAEVGTWAVDLSGVSNHLQMSNSAVSVIKNGEYRNIITANTGYEIDNDNVIIKMSGTNITESAWQISGNIYIGSVTGNLEITVPAIAIQKVIDATLENCSGDNDDERVDYNDPYVNNLTADSGYTFNGVTPTILMDDEPVSGAWTVGADGTTATINIAHVTGFVEIIVSAAEATATVTNTLTNCTGNNSATSVNIGSSYTNTITPDVGYTLNTLKGAIVSIIMGDQPVSAWSYDSSTGEGTISIASVTGNISISIAAAEIQPEPARYVQFTAKQTNSQVSLKAANGASYQYCIDGSTWNNYTSETTITLASVGDFVRFRGNDNTGVTYSSSNYSQFTMSGKIEASGNVNYLLSPTGDATLVKYCFANLFKGCTSLTTAPELPSTILADNCYNGMFQGCTSLTTAPELPATNLDQGCYYYMFSSCTSLITAPELPATTLANVCYAAMFSGCTSLTIAPELPATTLDSQCYFAMFQGCTSLTTAPELPATTLTSTCYFAMFDGCSALNSVTISAVTWNPDNAANWLRNTAATGTLTCPTACSIPSNSTSGIPTGWTRINV